MKTDILSFLNTFFINIDQNLILISSALLTTLVIYLVLSSKKRYLWTIIYLSLIILFVLFIFSFVYIYIIADILKEINAFFELVRYVCYILIMEFNQTMVMGSVFEDSFLADSIISTMDNRSDGGSTPPRSPWVTRPVTPEVLVAVTPPNLPNFDPSVWVKGTVPTEFSQEQDRIAAGIISPNINPAAVGYFHGRSTGAINHHTIFSGPLYPYTHIQGVGYYDDGSTYNIWVSPGKDTHTYYIAKNNYNTLHQEIREDIIRYDSRLNEVRNMTSFQRWSYFNRTADASVKKNLTFEVARILDGHQIPIANLHV